MRELIMVSGPPGCGKSTWIESKLKDFNPDRATAIHRDDVRLQLRIEKNTVDYFPVTDKEELDRFVQEVNIAIGNPQYNTIYVDATFINQGSRRKFLSLLDLKEMALTCVNFVISSEEALARNNSRKGYEKVPASVVKRMIVQQEIATKEELREISNAAKVYVFDIESDLQ
jgi:predicted kinase